MIASGLWRLGIVLDLGEQNLLFVVNHRLRHLRLADVGRRHRRDLHADVLGKLRELGLAFDAAGRLELRDDAGRAVAVDIGAGHALDDLEAGGWVMVFADGENLVLHFRVNGAVGAVERQREQRLDVRRSAGENRAQDTLDELAEGGVVGDEIGLGVDLDDRGGQPVVALEDVHDALGGDAVALFRGDGKSFFTQDFHRLIEIALGSTSAFLHSIIPMPVFLRSSITSFAAIFAMMLVNPFVLKWGVSAFLTPR